MEDKKLLIVGIDPGTTIGYAALDIEGKLIRLDSSKELSLNSLISQTIHLGKAALVGTDKSKVPSLVHAFASNLGAEIVSPEEDLKVKEKKDLISSYEHANEHEGDALASALFTYRSAKPLLDKIDFFVEENGKQSIRNRIKELVILKKINIKNAVSIIEKEHEEDKILERVVFESKLSEFDYLRLYKRLKKHESELRLLRNYNSKLERKLAFLEKKHTVAGQKSDTRSIDYKENRIRFYSSLMRLKDDEINQLKCQLKKFGEMLMNPNEFCILKKMNTLGINEYNFKNRTLNIQRNDVLLVNDPNIISNDVVEMLKCNVFVIIHKEAISKKNESNLPFIFVDAANLKIQEYGHFGIVEKKAFEAEKSKTNWMRKIVEDYKKEKLVLR